MKVILDLCVVPLGVGLSVSKYVAACEEVLREAGLEAHLHAYGTNVEGDWDVVLAAVKRCHEVVHEMGAPRITTSIRLGTRTDREQSIVDKVRSVERKLYDAAASPVYHIIQQSAWKRALAGESYIPESVRTEGFIHCSTREQILLPANSLFRGQRDLILLEIEPARVTAEIVYEDCYQSGNAFPHIYGPLNLEAVVRTIPFPCQSDGSFSLPPAISGD